MPLIDGRGADGVVQAHGLLQGSDPLGMGEAGHHPHQVELHGGEAVGIDENARGLAVLVPFDGYAIVRA